MKLMTARQERKLREKGRINSERTSEGAPTIDFKPVVKLFCPWNGATWLLTELDPEDLDVAFGLCDLGAGEPEIGVVSLAEIKSVRGPMGLKIERDLHFKAGKTLEQYANEARQFGRVSA